MAFFRIFFVVDIVVSIGGGDMRRVFLMRTGGGGFGGLGVCEGFVLDGVFWFLLLGGGECWTWGWYVYEKLCSAGLALGLEGGGEGARAAFCWV